jgi:hypothetical protein
MERPQPCYRGVRGAVGNRPPTCCEFCHPCLWPCPRELPLACLMHRCAGVRCKCTDMYHQLVSQLPSSPQGVLIVESVILCV